MSRDICAYTCDTITTTQGIKSIIFGKFLVSLCFIFFVVKTFSMRSSLLKLFQMHNTILLITALLVQQISGTLSSCLIITLYPIRTFPHVSWYFSASVSVTIIDTSQKRNRKIFVLLKLTYPTQHNVFQVHHVVAEGRISFSFLLLNHLDFQKKYYFGYFIRQIPLDKDKERLKV